MAASAADQLKKALREKIPPKAIQRATARALNKAIVSVRAEAARGVKAELPSLKAADIKDAMRIERTKGSTSVGEQSAAVVVSARPVELYRFAAKPRRLQSARGPRVGVTVKVKKERKVVAGAFIAQMKSGKVGVWKAAGGTTKSGKSRINLLYSTTVQDIFLNDGFMAPLQDFARARLETVLAQELAFETSKVKGG
jgi:hypothetical protein